MHARVVITCQTGGSSTVRTDRSKNPGTTWHRPIRSQLGGLEGAQEGAGDEDPLQSALRDDHLMESGLQNSISLRIGRGGLMAMDARLSGGSNTSAHVHATAFFGVNKKVAIHKGRRGWIR